MSKGVKVFLLATAVTLAAGAAVYFYRTRHVRRGRDFVGSLRPDSVPEPELRSIDIEDIDMPRLRF